MFNILNIHQTALDEVLELLENYNDLLTLELLFPKIRNINYYKNILKIKGMKCFTKWYNENCEKGGFDKEELIVGHDGVVLPNCNLTYIPESIREIDAELLTFSNNSLVSLPKGLFTMTNLTALYLYSNFLYTSNLDSVGNLINLEELSLSHNNLDTIPETLKFCKKLRYLYISHNKLEKVELYNTKLEILFLDFNKIREINITKLKNLLEFRISCNKLMELPKGIISLKRLDVLDISLNCIKNVPKLQIPHCLDYGQRI